jgi:hypothetical protein
MIIASENPKHCSSSTKRWIWIGPLGHNRIILKHDHKDLLQHITVHQVRDNKGSAELMTKKIVLDPQNPSMFPNSKYLTMTSETLFVVGDNYNVFFRL